MKNQTKTSPAKLILQSRLRSLLSLVGLFLTSMFFLASLANAATITDRPLLFSFDGSDTTAGTFKHPTAVAIDNTTGDVYVYDNSGSPVHGVVDKFDAEGEAKSFTDGEAIGNSSLNGPPSTTFKPGSFAEDIAIDNSTANPGRLYINEDGGATHAFGPEGNYLWTLPSTTVDPCSIATDGEGHLWITEQSVFVPGGIKRKALEFASIGTPPSELKFESLLAGEAPCRLGLDKTGNTLYVADYINYGGTRRGVAKYVNGVFEKYLTPTDTSDIAIDQTTSTGHVFTIHADSFAEFDSSGILVGDFGDNLIGDGRGVAYNPASDLVYVSDLVDDSVKVFGPTTTGTAPDVSTETTDSVTRTTAVIHAAINPQSVPNSYHFEWKAGTGLNWGTANSSSLQSIIPTDNNFHSVSFPLSGLNQNTTYQVRLVGTNSENHLNTYSSPDTFTTLAPAPPLISNLSVSEATINSAHVTATIDPDKDTLTWRVFKAARVAASKAECKTLSDDAFANAEEATVPVQPGVVEVHADLIGLLPAQTYCIRVVAVNSGGTGSADETFQTLGVAPDGGSTAFAAPRTDTTARINGRVNPEGEYDLTYRFEWSKDGVNWIPLSDRVSNVDAREQIVVSDELIDLEPDTTYYYRLAAAENESGGAASLPGAVKTFTTRSAAEVAVPGRGSELVNNADKGNQNVRVEIAQGGSPISVDGERVIWNVLAGVPGGNTGSGATFLAQRTDQGWYSRSLIPPADRQLKADEAGGYLLAAATPELSSFVFNVGVVSLEKGKTLVRLDPNQNQVLLGEYPEAISPDRVDISDDGVHVLFINPATQQLEDIGTDPAEVVSVMPNGSPSECGLARTGFPDENNSFVGGGNAPQAAAVQWRPGYHMIATIDATRVYFQVKPNVNCKSELYGIYERNRDVGEVVKGEPIGQTTLIDPGTGSSPQFIRATPDGRSAYFGTYSSCRKYNGLSCEISEPADTNTNPDIYRWDEATGQSTCLTCVVPNADVRLTTQSVLMSDNLSHIYFESSRQLIPGEGKEGDFNLYLLNRGEIHFVTDMNAASGSLGSANALLSEDGDVLVFKAKGEAQARQQLTSDLLAPGCGIGESCLELYRYENHNGAIECISCRHDGFTEDSVDILAGPSGHDFKISSDGSTVAFVTSETLVPPDVNGTNDIYEWRNGVVRLVSSGLTTYPIAPTSSPQVHAVSGEGRDILFSLVDPTLTGFERDDFANLYDARIGGGFKPPLPNGVCEGDSCQGPLQPAPSAKRAGSLNFHGRGNAVGTSKSRCRRGKVRRRGRCVKHKPLRHHRHGHSARGRTTHTNQGSAK